MGVLDEMKQYHFDRQDFCHAFENIFTTDEILDIEELCLNTTTLDHFHLFYTKDEEYYIVHLPSGTMINWYKHLGRTNTCNKNNYTLNDLNRFLKALKKEMK